MSEVLDKRPVLQLPRTKLEIVAEIAALLGLLSTAGMLLGYWSDLPPQVPRHFNAAGEADAWSGKGFILFLPSVGFWSYMGLSILSRYPHIYNYPFKLTRANVESQYRLARGLIVLLKAEILWIFAYITWKAIQTAMGNAAGLGWAFLPAVLIANFGAIGIYFYLAYRAR